MQEQNDLRRIVQAGTRAPSGDNCQPWLFRVGRDTIELHLDPARSDFFIDYDLSATFVSLGAAIENMVLAASVYSLTANVSLFPAPGNRHHVATLHLVPGATPHPLAQQIGARCTNRTKFERQPLPDREHDAIRAVPAPVGAALHLVTGAPSLKAIASVVALVDRTIFEHPRLHGDLFRWTRWSSGARDGLSLRTLELNALDRGAFRLMSSWSFTKTLNLFGLSVLAGWKNSHLLTHAAAVGLISAEGGSDVEYVEGGRYFERIWLSSTALGLSLHPSGSLPFLLRRQRCGGEGLTPHHRARLSLVGERLEALFPEAAKRTPIMLFRLGCGGVVSERSERRELSEVLLSSAGEAP